MCLKYHNFEQTTQEAFEVTSCSGINRHFPACATCSINFHCLSFRHPSVKPNMLMSAEDCISQRLRLVQAAGGSGSHQAVFRRLTSIS
ncbi:hypothetical protein CEXT_273141 [Caerostris extrusa]|uniref:Uncharacterized protein n=1 Tax=Caerostris extrusa TaxID=172846 RepID=A0AAV4M9Z3_CAEEX|nr:hypothetical protein CEXT_273141 [Caerostris extrusa]